MNLYRSTIGHGRKSCRSMVMRFVESQHSCQVRVQTDHLVMTMAQELVLEVLKKQQELHSKVKSMSQEICQETVV